MNAIKEEILSNSGLKEEINEGIKYFKDSKRLRKLSNKIAIRATKAAGNKGFKEVEEIIEKLEKVADEFEDLENRFNIADRKEKKQIKNEYNLIKQSYEELIKIINRQTFNALAKAGFNLALIAAPMIFAYIKVAEIGESVKTMTGDYTKDTAITAAAYGSRITLAGHKGLDPEKISWLMSTYNVGRKEAERMAMDNAMTAGGTAIIGGPTFDEVGAGHVAGVMGKVKESFNKTLGFIGLTRLFHLVSKRVKNPNLAEQTRIALENLQKKQI